MGGLLEDGKAVPAPSSLEAVMATPENQGGVVILVTARVAPKTVRVNVTLPEDVLQQIDRYAESHGYTQSGFLAAAAKRVIAMETA